MWTSVAFLLQRDPVFYAHLTPLVAAAAERHPRVRLHVRPPLFDCPGLVAALTALWTAPLDDDAGSDS